MSKHNYGATCHQTKQNAHFLGHTTACRPAWKKCAKPLSGVHLFVLA